MSFNLFGKTFYFLSDERQIEKAIDMLEKYIFKPEIIVLLLILALYFVVCLIAKIRKEKNALNILKRISPWVYLLVILGITVLNRTPGDREIRLYHDAWFTQNGFHESNVLGFMFNLVLYIPYGFLLAKCLKKNPVTIAVVVVTSFIIEALQYIFMRGVTAIDDLVANIVGGICGILLLTLAKKFKSRKV